MKFAVLSSLALLCVHTVLAAEPSKVITLWPDGAPGEKLPLPEEGNQTKPTDKATGGKPVKRLGNISNPTLTIYRPPADKNTGTAVLVCPGGGYNIVAIDIEGTEICHYFNSLGITAGLLKYRVPRRVGLEKHVAPLQDAQRAMGILRSSAGDLGIATNRIGIIGFSAGGHLAATLAANPRQRTYSKVDDADTASCRPDFAMLIYPAYFTTKEDLTALTPEVQVTTNHPPTFMVMTQDDGQHVENVLLYSLALKKANIPFELHTYTTGGHGYGMRPTDQIVAHWPDRATEWLTSRKLLPPK